MMKNKQSNPRTRCKVYAELTRIFPEGIFKGFTYPNLHEREDYTLRILSGKRGETGSISVCESSEANGSDEEEIDLGSDADTDNEEKNYEESAVITRVFPQKNFLPIAAFFPEHYSGQPGWAVSLAGKVQGKPDHNPTQAQEPKAQGRGGYPGGSAIHQQACFTCGNAADPCLTKEISRQFNWCGFPGKSP